MMISEDFDTDCYMTILQTTDLLQLAGCWKIFMFANKSFSEEIHFNQLMYLYI